MPRKKIKKPLTIAMPECCFWTHDGAVLKNLQDLQQALKQMSDETFKHHVNKEKNDFAKWAEEILEDPVLAKKLKPIKTKKNTLKALSEHLQKEYK